MSEVLEEYITLTPLTCVQQVNALLDATSSKPGSCKVLYALFGVYCGVLAYRAYRNHCAKRNEVGAAPVLTASLPTDHKEVTTILLATPSHVSEEQLVPQPSPILLQPADFSSTDMRWRYGPPTAAVLKPGCSLTTDVEEPFPKSVNESNEEPEVASVSVGTSTMGKRSRTHEDKIEGETPQTTFSV